MPIRINLLAETIAEEEMRRRDPVKRASYISVLLVILTLVWYVSAFLQAKLSRREYNFIQAEIQAKSNDCVVVKSNQKKIIICQQRLEALNTLSAGRMLQGNLLNALQQIYQPNVQMVRIRVENSYTLNKSTPSITNNFGVVPGLPATSTEKVLLTLDARDSSANPGDMVNRFKESLIVLDYFKSCLNSNNAVKLASLTPPTSTFDSKPYVIFSLECRYQDKSR